MPCDLIDVYVPSKCLNTCSVDYRMGGRVAPHTTGPSDYACLITFRYIPTSATTVDLVEWADGIKLII